jgi:hypothetical protein
MDTSATNARTEPATPSVEAVADMLETLDAADLHRAIAELEDLLATLRPAASVRTQLAAVDRKTLQAALILRRQRARLRRR